MHTDSDSPSPIFPGRAHAVDVRHLIEVDALPGAPDKGIAPRVVYAQKGGFRGVVDCETDEQASDLAVDIIRRMAAWAGRE